jgi:hypothetical protein
LGERLFLRGILHMSLLDLVAKTSSYRVILNWNNLCKSRVIWLVWICCVEFIVLGLLLVHKKISRFLTQLIYMLKLFPHVFFLKLFKQVQATLLSDMVSNDSHACDSFSRISPKLLNQITSSHQTTTETLNVFKLVTNSLLFYIATVLGYRMQINRLHSIDLVSGRSWSHTKTIIYSHGFHSNSTLANYFIIDIAPNSGETHSLRCVANRNRLHATIYGALEEKKFTTIESCLLSKTVRVQN